MRGELGADFSALFSQVAEFARQGTSFVFLVATALGIFFIASALLWTVQKGGRNQAAMDRTWGAILMRLFWATCLITLARMFDNVAAINGSVDGARQALAYFQGNTGGSALGAVYSALATWCVFIGMIGFCRGFVLFDKASQGSHTSGDDFWRGLWHVIGGVLTVQIFS